MLMPFCDVILFSVRLAAISLSFERCIGFYVFASVTEPKDSPTAGLLIALSKSRLRDELLTPAN
jgi:hypothetical protein